MSEKEKSKSENISKAPLFKEINDDLPETTEVESLCMNCSENGLTRLLLTKIPYYKELIIMSFHCSHCGYENNEIQPGGIIEEQGVRIKLLITSIDDLDRQVIKSDFTTTKIPHIDFEIPSQSQKGEVTNIEGIINRIVAGLTQDQEKRRSEHPEVAVQIEDFITKLVDLKLVREPYTIIFEDISGNSFVQNPHMPKVDTNCEITYFNRKKEDDHRLGIFTKTEIQLDEEQSIGILQSPDKFTLEDLESEVAVFPTNCPNCNSPANTKMKMTDIPYFKQVVIMATLCDTCGHRTNEVKSGGGIEPEGIRIELNVETKEDLTRDVLKSETCSIHIPEIDLEVGSRTLGGKFSTVEGLMVSIRDQLEEQNAMFSDSRDPAVQQEMSNFLEKFIDYISVNKEFTLILDDPAGNSFVQSFNDSAPDSNMIVTRYERSFEQNDDLGINDMKLENYENS